MLFKAVRIQGQTNPPAVAKVANAISYFGGAFSMPVMLLFLAYAARTKRPSSPKYIIFLLVTVLLMEDMFRIICLLLTGCTAPSGEQNRHTPPKQQPFRKSQGIRGFFSCKTVYKAREMYYT